MMQGVNGPNSQVLFHKKQSNSNGSQGLDSNEMGLNNNRFKASSSDNLELESDPDDLKQLLRKKEDLSAAKNELMMNK